MSKLLNEILENHPELEENKDSLEKIINTLGQNNPKIMASKEFKESLKSRIDGLIGIKQNKKSNFVIFAIPLFSFMFVIGGFFYYFKDINFFNDGEILESQLLKVNEDSILDNELDNIISTFEAEILSEEKNIEKSVDFASEKIENPKNENIKSFKSQAPIEVETMSVFSDNIDEADEKYEEIQADEVQEIEQNNTNEDNQIIDILDSIQTEIDETFDDSMINQDIENEIESIMDFSGFGDSDFESFDIMETRIYEYSFEDFCRDNSGEISGTGETLKCIKNDIECGSSDFENGACSFDETK